MDFRSELKRKLSDFIRKYYWNRIIKGVLVELSVLIISVFLAITPEIFLYASPVFKSLVLLILLSVIIFSLGFWIIWPVLELFKLKKGLTKEQAAKYIGKHFPEIDDKLLNYIQLEEEASHCSNELLLASIAQKAKNLSGFSFSKSISFRSNTKYLYRIIGVLFVLSLIYYFFPTDYNRAATRIYDFNTKYEKPAPFKFLVDDDSLRVIQNEAFVFRCRIEGDYIPDEVFLYLGDDHFLMKRSGDSFEYRVQGLNESKRFYFASDKVRSAQYDISVYALPIILEYDLLINYPKYTNRKNDTIYNNGDVLVPEGSILEWSFYTQDVDTILFFDQDTNQQLEAVKKGLFKCSRVIYSDKEYGFYPINENIRSKDSVKNKITVIKDGFPTIVIREFSDSIAMHRRFFTGSIADDYGFHKLNFVVAENDIVIHIEDIDITNSRKQSFFSSYDFQKLQRPGRKLNYYFEIYDNDAINGSKKTTSNNMQYRFMTDIEIDRQIKSQNENILSRLNDEVLKTEDLKKAILELKQRLIEEADKKWDNKKAYEDIFKELEVHKKALEDLQKELKENRGLEEQLTEKDKRILEKQKELEKLLDEVLDEEMQKQLEDLRKLMEELTADNMQDAMDKLEDAADNLEKNIDRSLELFKQLKFEKELQSAIEKSKDLKTEQDALREEVENTRRSKLPELTEKEELIKEGLEELKKELEELSQQNKQLEKPNSFKTPDEEMEKAEKAINESKEELQQKNKSGSQQKMQESGEQLDGISLQLQLQQEKMAKEAIAEDIESLKQLLENIIYLSFNQENLINDFNTVSMNDPIFLEKVQAQFFLKEQSQIVKDSLIALSKRQAMIQNFVLNEIEEIDYNMDAAIDYFNNRNINSGVGKQQFAMTHINNLALMLSEALKNMQKSMMSLSSGQGNPKPGQGKPSMSELRKMQEQLKKQMEQMKSGQGKPQSGKSMSEKMARMAAKQSYIRRKLEQYREDLMKQGNGDQGLSRTIKKMEENETDLVNKRITKELINRQEEIITRLLKSEKAEREQEKEEKREGKSGEELLKDSPDILEYQQMIKRSQEILESIPPEMKPFYKNKVNSYFLKDN